MSGERFFTADDIDTIIVDERNHGLQQVVRRLIIDFGTSPLEHASII